MKRISIHNFFQKKKNKIFETAVRNVCVQTKHVSQKCFCFQNVFFFLQIVILKLLYLSIISKFLKLLQKYLVQVSYLCKTILIYYAEYACATFCNFQKKSSNAKNIKKYVL